MPVLPDVESRMVFPDTNRPWRMRSWIISSAGRSFTEPPGFKPSSLPKMRTPCGTPSRTRVISTSGVFPISWSTEGETIGPAPGAVGPEKKRAWATSGGMRSRLASSRDGRHDRQLVARLERGLQVLEEADVLAVDEDVDEALHLSRFVTDALPDAGIAGIEIDQQCGHRAALRLDGLGAAGELAQRRGHSHLGHVVVPPVGFRMRAARGQPADASRLPRSCAYRASKSPRRAGMRNGCSTPSVTASSVLYPLPVTQMTMDSSAGVGT